MANKQPWYHEIEILYTTTTGRCLNERQRERIKQAICSSAGRGAVLPGSVEFNEAEPEPGDPADLM